MELALNIPMSANPTRQKFWRVLRVVGIIFGAWSIVTGIHRIAFEFSSVIPPADAVAIRIPRNDSTIANLRSLTKGMNVVPGVPLSLADALNSTNRTLNVWFAPDGGVTLILDREFSDSEATAIASFGAGVSRENGLTIISDRLTATPVSQSVFQNIFPALLSGNSAVLTLNDRRTDISIEPGKITLRGTAFLAAPNIDEPVTANTVLAVDIPAADISALLPRAFTQNTPGFSSLFLLAAQNGVSAHISLNGDIASYTLALPLTAETQLFANEDSLTHIAKELVEVPTIDGITTFLDDGSRTTTLRSREEASVLVRDDAPYRFVTATSSYGTIYITQIPTLLTVSNHVQDTNTPHAREASCLSDTIAFAQPKKLFSSMESNTFYQTSSLSNLLWRASEVASTLSTTRICIDE
ncbi:MAG: hypothetical protein AAB473_04090 [Patescibacteria group bacterium]